MRIKCLLNKIMWTGALKPKPERTFEKVFLRKTHNL